MLVTGASAAFTAGQVFWVPSSCETPCGVFEVTGGGTFGSETLLAEMTDSPGQIAWSADRETLYVSKFFLHRILAITSNGSVSVFATGVGQPTGLLHASDGRLLAVSFQTKSVIDISAGGDFSTAQDFAYGLLSGPFDLVEDAAGRLLASTFHGVFDVSAGGDLTGASAFAWGADIVGLAVDGSGRTPGADTSSNAIFDITSGDDQATASAFAEGMPGYGDTALDAVPALAPAPPPVPSLGGAGTSLLGILLLAGGTRSLRPRAAYAR